MSVNAYPLTWPAGWKRTPAHQRKRALFSRAGKKDYGGQSFAVQHRLSVSDGTQRVRTELSRLGCRADDAILSTNIALRLDGLPRSDQREPDDPGVAVYWTRGKRNEVMAIDRYDRVADNLAAIAATLEALRAIERHGGGAILERAFTGFVALPEPKSWREVLGINSQAVTFEGIKAQYRTLARVRHPDAGGSAAAMAELNAAWEQARAELGG